MDILTHYMTGYLFARLHGSNRIQILAITFAAVIPDIDFLFMLMGHTAGEELHRGRIHSIAGIVIIASLIYLAVWLYRKESCNLRLGAFILLAGLSHAFLDLFSYPKSFMNIFNGTENTYEPVYLDGVRLFWPLDKTRYSFNTYIPDNYIIIIMIAIFTLAVCYMVLLIRAGERPWAVWKELLFHPKKD